VLTAYNLFGSTFASVGGRDPATAFAAASPDGSNVSLVQNRIQLLQEALDNNMPGQEVQRRMVALRDARRQARKDLDQAREDLVGLLTARQEAILLQIGLLE
jgi:hypothetical protein